MRVKRSAWRSLVIGFTALAGLIFVFPGWAQPVAPVTWKDSRLSVQFDNASIGSILSTIAGQTRINLSVDPSVASYRESVSFNSFPLRDAILKVLEGSNIDYIIVGDPASSEGVQKVMLLGFAQKLPEPSYVAPTSAASAQGGGAVNPYANQLPNIFSRRPISGQTGPAQAQPAGRFLPFPEASEGSNPNDEGEQPNSVVKPVVPNPFNPVPAGTGSPQQQNPRKPPGAAAAWPPQNQ